MIYVRRNSSLIPEKVLKVAERAQQTLEALPADERPAFIKKKAHVWRAFRPLPVADVLRQVLVF